MELGRCARMSALISAEQCERNQKRGVFSCDSCPGLADVVEIDIEEVAAMSVKKCKVEGCEKQAQAGRDGMCHAHWREATCTPRKPWGSNRKEQVATKEVETTMGTQRDNQLESILEVVVAPLSISLEDLNPFIPPGEIKPVRGLAGMLATTGLPMSIPWELAGRMAAADVSVDDVVELVGMLLDGKLRKA
jgi:hypothetical protein